MIPRDEIIDFIHHTIGQDILDQAHLMDDMPNGIQFHGSEKVSKLALGVSLNQTFLQEATNWHAQFCIFHHAFDIRAHKSLYPPYSQQRLRLIIQHDLTIAGYHAALDIHPTLGNNAVIASQLKLKPIDTYFEGWGIVGELSKPISVKAIQQRCEKLFNRKIIVFNNGLKTVTRIGVCSGASKPYSEHIFEMITKGVQLHISGESSESSPHKMLESNINYFICGHYATEIFGVKALGEKIQHHFGNQLQVKFIDIPNPI